jgi:hypothetical protein
MKEIEIVNEINRKGEKVVKSFYKMERYGTGFVGKKYIDR